MQRTDEIIERGTKWLEVNGDLPSAGAVIACLRAFKPSIDLTELAQQWLQSYPEELDAPDIVAYLLESKPSEQLLLAARDLIEQVFTPPHNTNRKLRIARVIRVISLRFSDSDVAECVAQSLDKFPENEIWEHVFPISTYDCPNRFAEELTARWINHTLDDPHLWCIALSAVATLTPCEKVVDACFQWIQRGGKNSENMPRVLQDVVSESSNYANLLPDIAAYSREWLIDNHDHEIAGQIYGSLIVSTKDPQDMETALDWYKTHEGNSTSMFLISDMLEFARRTSTPPHPFAVEKAKEILRSGGDSFPRLVGTLLSVCPDPETIGWAKDTFKRQKVGWIAVRLLRHAPDEESVSLTMSEIDDWFNSSMAPDLLMSLLSADPLNEEVRERAANWLENNPTDHGFIAVKNALEKPRVPTD